MNYNKKEICDALRKKLSDKRYEHSIGVEYTAAALAMYHKEDIEKASIAGLLHDCAKYYKPAELLEKSIKFKLPVSNDEKKSPELLHAKLSAYYAEHKYNITESDVLSAITYHTTGKPDMTTLEKIIFIADYIEPNRKPLYELNEIRAEAFKDLDQCILHIIKNTLIYLENKGSAIDETTIHTYEFYNK